MTNLASPVPFTAEELAERLGFAQALVCQLTDRVDERVLSHPGLLARTERVVLAVHAGSATARTRERMSHLAVDGLLREMAAGQSA